MSFFIGILTFFLVIDCLVLILLVLVQLPKKDAGAGLAFGGGAADALFGAGSGNALTKITKYATIIFFGLALAIGVLQDRTHRGNSAAFEKQVDQAQAQSQAPGSTPAPATLPAAAPKTTLLTAQPVADSNAPAAPAPVK
jgi:preprotein translocase subunit SecG